MFFLIGFSFCTSFTTCRIDGTAKVGGMNNFVFFRLSSSSCVHVLMCVCVSWRIFLISLFGCGVSCAFSFNWTTNSAALTTCRHIDSWMQSMRSESTENVSETVPNRNENWNIRSARIGNERQKQATVEKRKFATFSEHSILRYKWRRIESATRAESKYTNT